MNLKKLISLFTAVCFLTTFAGQNLAWAAPSSGAKSDISEFKKIFENIPKIPIEYGKVTNITDFGSKSIVINIQDLHCHPEAQKNISKIIEILDNNYKVRSVYVEGAYDKIDTGWISDIEDKTLRDAIAEQMIEDGTLNASEYYAVKNNKRDFLLGLEDEKRHKENILRLGYILDNQERYEEVLSDMKKQIAYLSSKYANNKNKRFDRTLTKYKKDEINPQKFYSLLYKYVTKINENPENYNNVLPIKFSNYPNMTNYMLFSEYSSKLEMKKVYSQLQALLSLLKEKLPFAAFNMFVDETENLSNIDKLSQCLSNFCSMYDIDLDVNYKQLNAFFKLQELSRSINPLDLINEERHLIERLRAALSYDQTESEIAFLSDFYDYFSDYLQNKLMADDFAYFSSRFEKFRELYSKYNIKNSMLSVERDFVTLHTYYKLNDQRNDIFSDNIFKYWHPDSEKSEKPAARTPDDIFNSAEEIVIVVTGGYHSYGLKELFTQKGVTNMILTPTVTTEIARAEEIYEEIILQQSIFLREALAFTVVSQATSREQFSSLIAAGAKFLQNTGYSESTVRNLIEHIKKASGNNDITVQATDNETVIKFKNGSSITLQKGKNGTIKVLDSTNPKKNKKLTLPKSANVKNIIKKAIQMSTLPSEAGAAVLMPDNYNFLKNILVFAYSNNLLNSDFSDGLTYDANEFVTNNLLKSLDGIDIDILKRMPEIIQTAALEQEKQSMAAEAAAAAQEEIKGTPEAQKPAAKPVAKKAPNLFKKMIISLLIAMSIFAAPATTSDVLSPVTDITLQSASSYTETYDNSAKDSSVLASIDEATPAATPDILSPVTDITPQSASSYTETDDNSAKNPVLASIDISQEEISRALGNDSLFSPSLLTPENINASIENSNNPELRLKVQAAFNELQANGIIEKGKEYPVIFLNGWESDNFAIAYLDSGFILVPGASFNKHYSFGQEKFLLVKISHEGTHFNNIGKDITRVDDESMAYDATAKAMELSHKKLVASYTPAQLKDKAVQQIIQKSADEVQAQRYVADAFKTLTAGNRQSVLNIIGDFEPGTEFSDLYYFEISFEQAAGSEALIPVIEFFNEENGKKFSYFFSVDTANGQITQIRVVNNKTNETTILRYELRQSINASLNAHLEMPEDEFRNEMTDYMATASEFISFYRLDSLSGTQLRQGSQEAVKKSYTEERKKLKEAVYEKMAEGEKTFTHQYHLIAVKTDRVGSALAVTGKGFVVFPEHLLYNSDGSEKSLDEQVEAIVGVVCHEATHIESALNNIDGTLSGNEDEARAVEAGGSVLHKLYPDKFPESFLNEQDNLAAAFRAMDQEKNAAALFNLAKSHEPATQGFAYVDYTVPYAYNNFDHFIEIAEGSLSALPKDNVIIVFHDPDRPQLRYEVEYSVAKSGETRNPSIVKITVTDDTGKVLDSKPVEEQKSTASHARLTMTRLANFLDRLNISDAQKNKIILTIETPIMMLGMVVPFVRKWFLNRHDPAERASLAEELRDIDTETKKAWRRAVRYVNSQTRDMFPLIRGIYTLIFAYHKASAKNKELHERYNSMNFKDFAGKTISEILTHINGGIGNRDTEERNDSLISAFVARQFKTREKGITELISNALDTDSENVNVSMEPGIVSVANDAAQGISMRTVFENLINISNSTKAQKDKQIGRFGLGFFSALNYLEAESDTLEIVSLRSDQSFRVTIAAKYEKGLRTFYVKSVESISKAEASAQVNPSADRNGTAIILKSQSLHSRISRKNIENGIVSDFSHSLKPLNLQVNGKPAITLGTEKNDYTTLRRDSGNPGLSIKNAKKSILPGNGKIVVTIKGVKFFELPVLGSNAFEEVLVELPNDLDFAISRDSITINEKLTEYIKSLISYTAESNMSFKDKMALLNALYALSEQFERQQKGFIKSTGIQNMAETLIAVEIEVAEMLNNPFFIVEDTIENYEFFGNTNARLAVLVNPNLMKKSCYKTKNVEIQENGKQKFVFLDFKNATNYGNSKEFSKKNLIMLDDLLLFNKPGGSLQQKTAGSLSFRAFLATAKREIAIAHYRIQTGKNPKFYEHKTEILYTEDHEEPKTPVVHNIRRYNTEKGRTVKHSSVLQIMKSKLGMSDEAKISKEISQTVHDLNQTEGVFVRELLKNSRAAGASSININVNEESGVMTLEDNGQGMDSSDIENLLIPSLGGNTERNVFGNGIFSLFRENIEQVVIVTSKNGKTHSVELYPLYDENGRVANIEYIIKTQPYSGANGTRVELHMHDKNISYLFENALKHLRLLHDGIAVKLNGKKFDDFLDKKAFAKPVKHKEYEKISVYKTGARFSALTQNGNFIKDIGVDFLHELGINERHEQFNLLKYLLDYGIVLELPSDIALLINKQDVILSDEIKKDIAAYLFDAFVKLYMETAEANISIIQDIPYDYFTKSWANNAATHMLNMHPINEKYTLGQMKDVFIHINNVFTYYITAKDIFEARQKNNTALIKEFCDYLYSFVEADNAQERAQQAYDFIMSSKDKRHIANAIKTIRADVFLRAYNTLFSTDEAESFYLYKMAEAVKDSDDISELVSGQGKLSPRQENKNISTLTAAYTSFILSDYPTAVNRLPAMYWKKGEEPHVAASPELHTIYQIVNIFAEALTESYGYKYGVTISIDFNNSMNATAWANGNTITVNLASSPWFSDLFENNEGISRSSIHKFIHQHLGTIFHEFTHLAEEKSVGTHNKQFYDLERDIISNFFADETLLNETIARINDLISKAPRSNRDFKEVVIEAFGEDAYDEYLLKQPRPLTQQAAADSSQQTAEKLLSEIQTLVFAQPKLNFSGAKIDKTEINKAIFTFAMPFINLLPYAAVSKTVIKSNKAKLDSILAKVELPVILLAMRFNTVRRIFLWMHGKKGRDGREIGFDTIANETKKTYNSQKQIFNDFKHQFNFIERLSIRAFIISRTLGANINSHIIWNIEHPEHKLNLLGNSGLFSGNKKALYESNLNSFEINNFDSFINSLNSEEQDTAAKLIAATASGNSVFVALQGDMVLFRDLTEGDVKALEWINAAQLADMADAGYDSSFSDMAERMIAALWTGEPKAAAKAVKSKYFDMAKAEEFFEQSLTEEERDAAMQLILAINQQDLFIIEYPENSDITYRSAKYYLDELKNISKRTLLNTAQKGKGEIFLKTANKLIDALWVSLPTQGNEIFEKIKAAIINDDEATLCFVCSANMNRSTLPHMIFQQILRNNGNSKFKVSSAGTMTEARHRENLGRKLDGKYMSKLTTVDDDILHSFTAEKFGDEHAKADYIIVAEDKHKNYILENYPHLEGKVFVSHEIIPDMENADSVLVMLSDQKNIDSLVSSIEDFASNFFETPTENTGTRLQLPLLTFFYNVFGVKDTTQAKITARVELPFILLAMRFNTVKKIFLWAHGKKNRAEREIGFETVAETTKAKYNAYKQAFDAIKEHFTFTERIRNRAFIISKALGANIDAHALWNLLHPEAKLSLIRTTAGAREKARNYYHRYNELTNKERAAAEEEILALYDRDAGENTVFVTDLKEMPDKDSDETKNRIASARNSFRDITKFTYHPGLFLKADVLNNSLSERIRSYFDKINAWQKGFDKEIFHLVPKNAIHMTLFNPVNISRLQTVEDLAIFTNPELRRSVIESLNLSGVTIAGNKKELTDQDRENIYSIIESIIISELDKMEEEGFFRSNIMPEFEVDGLAMFPSVLVLHTQPKTGSDFAVLAEIQGRLKDRLGVEEVRNFFNGHITIGHFINPFETKEQFDSFMAMAKDIDKDILTNLYLDQFSFDINPGVARLKDGDVSSTVQKRYDFPRLAARADSTVKESGKTTFSGFIKKHWMKIAAAGLALFMGASLLFMQIDLWNSQKEFARLEQELADYYSPPQAFYFDNPLVINAITDYVNSEAGEVLEQVKKDSLETSTDPENVELIVDAYRKLRSVGITLNRNYTVLFIEGTASDDAFSLPLLQVIGIPASIINSEDLSEEEKKIEIAKIVRHEARHIENIDDEMTFLEDEVTAWEDTVTVEELLNPSHEADPDTHNVLNALKILVRDHDSLIRFLSEQSEKDDRQYVKEDSEFYYFAVTTYNSDSTKSFKPTEVQIYVFDVNDNSYNTYFVPQIDVETGEINVIHIVNAEDNVLIKTVPFAVDDAQQTKQTPAPQTETPKAILPENIDTVNKMAQQGKGALEISGTVTFKELSKSMLHPISFIRSHESKAGKIGAAILVSVTFAVGLLSLFFPVFPAIAFPVAMLASVFTNITTHIIIDYHYIKASGLVQAVKEFGASATLTESGYINLPVYVISDKPENHKELGFENTGININGAPLWISRAKGAVVVYAEGASRDIIAREISSNRKINSFIKQAASEGAKTSLNNISVDWIEVDHADTAKPVTYSADGNAQVGYNLFKSMLDRGEMLDFTASVRANKNTDAFTLAQGLLHNLDDINSLEDFIEYLRQHQKIGNGQILINSALAKKITDEKGVKKFAEFLNAARKDGVQVFVFTDSAKMPSALENAGFAGFAYTDAETQKTHLYNYALGSASDSSTLNNFSSVQELENSIKNATGTIIINNSQLKGIINGERSGMIIGQIIETLSSFKILKMFTPEKMTDEFALKAARNFSIKDMPEITSEKAAQITALFAANNFEGIIKTLNLKESHPISVYIMKIRSQSQDINVYNAFVTGMTEKILAADSLRKAYKSNGLQDKNYEIILGRALLLQALEKTEGKGISVSPDSIGRTMKEAEENLYEALQSLMPKAFDNKEARAINAIIELIPAIAEERRRELNKDDIKPDMDMRQYQSILSAA